MLPKHYAQPKHDKASLGGNVEPIVAYLPKDNSSSSPSHDKRSKLHDRKYRKYIATRKFYFIAEDKAQLQSALVKLRRPKVFWDACFCVKMAADLFCFRVCVLFASFLVLTRGQNNRTVFLSSSTSGNSCLVVLG